jgi:hypothetical protein
LDLAGVDQLFDGAGHVLDWDVRVSSVLLEQVDAVGAEPAEHGLDDLADVVGLAVETVSLPGGGVDGEPELDGDHHLVAYRRQRFAYQLLVDERPVALGGIEEGSPRSTASRMSAMPAGRSPGWP